jgi:bifunctional non-homologous end joining protein LigD
MPPHRRAKSVEFSNVDKVFFPSGFRKGEMIQYYLEAAPYILPHLRDRPVTLIRFPNGVKGESFYEKNAPGFAPEWIDTYQVPRREHEGHINYILINKAETLAWCANLAALELHPFLHRVPEIDQPTHIAFDLDPGEGADIFTCAEVAFILRELFERLNLESFPKVSGSKGLQLYVPLNTPVTYDATQPFAKTVAELLEKEHPDLIVSQMPKALRKGRVLIDWSQNSQSKTTVCVYSLRGKRDEPFVSMPVSWRELQKAHRDKDRDALFFRPDAAIQRLTKLGDLFEPVLTMKQKLPDEFLGLAPKRRKTKASLARYAEKRDFSQTSEPAPEIPQRSRQGSRRRFVIQKHAASHLHYDFRLEMEDTLKSWAIPKGVPTELGVKRSAFQVEDHPLDYMEFEGTIPKGQYGGGTVMVWDIGTYDLIGGDLRKGDLKLWLDGKKLKGEWHMFRIKSEESKPVWLIIKGGKVAHKTLTAKQENTSVLSGRTMDEIAEANDAQWQSNRAEPDSAPSTSARRSPARERRDTDDSAPPTSARRSPARERRDTSDSASSTSDSARRTPARERRAPAARASKRKPAQKKTARK